ncbi:MAG TPA: hypothetical protein VFB79_16080 [Candidatus Angelobacter sp.]|nr:hypothetical protein [Candidatus Angelobacter sp.]
MSRPIYKAQTWPDILKLYRSREEKTRFSPMLVLLEQIASSRYAGGLYANTSMWDVLVVQTQEYDPDGEVLRISYNPGLQEFHFELQETSSTLYNRWARKCPAEKAFHTFERFLQMKKWFVEEIHNP